MPGRLDRFSFVEGLVLDGLFIIGLSYLGRHAVFASKASNLVAGDTNDAWDVFVRDTCLDYWTYEPISGCSPTTTRISTAPDGSQSNGDSGATAASPAARPAVADKRAC